MSEKHQDAKGAKCSFCGKPQAEVAKLIAAPGVYICDGCVYLCNEILSEESSADWAKEAALVAAHSERFELAERLVSMEHIGLELRNEAEGVLLEALRGRASDVHTDA